MKKRVELTDARKKLINGINVLADAVKITMGAAGNTVIIQDDYGKPKITKDGVTVAKSIVELEDPSESMGALVLSQAASKTASDAGDGTTTSTVIAQELINKADKVDGSKYLLSEVKKGMEKAVVDVIEFLERNSVKVDNDILLNVATISTNNDEDLGRVIADAFIKAGENGVVVMEESKTSETYVEKSEGMELHRGYASRYFVNEPEKERCVLNDCLVFISDLKIQNIRQIAHLLEFALNSSKSLLIISEMEDDLLATITLNKLKGGMKVNVIKPPMFGIKRKEILDDIATLTGAVVVSDDTGDNFDNVGVDFFGGCKKVTSDKHKTTIVAHKVNDGEVEGKVKHLNSLIKSSKSDVEKQWLSERVAKLVGGVSVVHVGANSEIELEEKKDRVDDAIHATKAAIEEGIVSGGGVALYDASLNIKSDGNKNEKMGYSLIVDAIRKPMWQIIRNAREDVDDVIKNIIDCGGVGYGYDVKSEKYGDMMEMGIIDPLKVTKNALRNAVSVASTVMTTGCTITNVSNG